jgi:hypothetical protein
MAILFGNGGTIDTSSSSVRFNNAIPRAANGNIPYVLAQKGNGGSNYTTTGRIQSWSTIFNDGNHFNATTGIFTAPITGQYFVYNWFMCSNNAAYVNRNYSIRRNNLTTSNNHNNVCYVYSSSTTAVHKQFSGGTIFRMSANDNIRLDNSNLSIYLASTVYNKLSIILLGVG